MLVSKHTVEVVFSRKVLFELFEAVHVIVRVDTFLSHQLECFPWNTSLVCLKVWLGSFLTRVSRHEFINWRLSRNNRCLPSVKAMYLSMLFRMTLMSMLLLYSVPTIESMIVVSN